MTTKASQYSIDGTAVKLLTGSNHYQNLNIHTDGAVFLGDTNAVTVASGYKLDVGDQGEFLISPYSDVWAISNGGTAKTAYTLVTVI